MDSQPEATELEQEQGPERIEEEEQMRGTPDEDAKEPELSGGVDR